MLIYMEHCLAIGGPVDSKQIFLTVSWTVLLFALAIRCRDTVTDSVNPSRKSVNPAVFSDVETDIDRCLMADRGWQF
jgi:hypothetical protein